MPITSILQHLCGFFFRGDGGIRTHVQGLTDNSISSRARYDRFDTSPDSVYVPDPISQKQDELIFLHSLGSTVTII